MSARRQAPGSLSRSRSAGSPGGPGRGARLEAAAPARPAKRGGPAKRKPAGRDVRQDSREPRGSPRDAAARRPAPRGRARPAGKGKGRARPDEASFSYSYSDRESYDEASLSESDSRLSGSGGSQDEKKPVVDKDGAKEAEKVRSRALADLLEAEKAIIAEVEAEEKEICDEKIEKLSADAEKEMKDKLEEFQELVQAERKSKIDQGTRLIETASKRKQRTALEEASAERKRKEQDVEADYDEAVQKAKKQREEVKKEEFKKKNARELSAALKKKDDAKTKVKPGRRHTKAPKDSSQQGASEGGRQGSRRAGENGERPGKRRKAVLQERDPERGRARDGQGGGRKRRVKDVRDVRDTRDLDAESRGSSDSRGKDGRAQRPGGRRGKGQGRRHDESHRRGGKSGGGGGGRSGGGGGGSRGGGGGRDLERFRDQYPMDDRAYDQLVDAVPYVQKAFLKSFKPRQEGEKDYSGLVVSFLRSVISRQEADRNKGSGRGTRGERPREGGRGRSRSVSRERSRSPRGQSSKRDLSPLSAFRSRYPMEASAFKQLESAPEEVRGRVMRDFKVRREGEKDYSGLVISFLRSVAERVGGGGKDRSRNNSPDRRVSIRKDDESDHRESPDGRRKVDKSEGSESPEKKKDDGLKDARDASGSPGRGGEDDGKDKAKEDKPKEDKPKEDRKDDEVSIASSKGQPEQK